MSVQAIGWVLEHSESQHSARLVMISIANYAKADGSGAWPSIATIARDARITDREVQLSIKDLERQGELQDERGAGPNGTNLYSVLMRGENSSPGGVKNIHRGGEESSPGGVNSDAKRGEYSSPKPKENRQVEPSLNQLLPHAFGGGVESLFDQLWRVYPRKIGRVPAFRAFSKLQPTQELVNEIIAAVEGYKLTDQWQRGSRYIPFLNKFLAQRRWLDCYPELSVRARG